MRTISPDLAWLVWHPGTPISVGNSCFCAPCRKSSRSLGYFRSVLVAMRMAVALFINATLFQFQPRRQRKNWYMKDIIEMLSTPSTTCLLTVEDMFRKFLLIAAKAVRITIVSNHNLGRSNWFIIWSVRTHYPFWFWCQEFNGLQLCLKLTQWAHNAQQPPWLKETLYKTSTI